MNINQIMGRVEKPYFKAGIPAFRPGDTVRVHVKVVEGDSERVQPFEGIVLRRTGGRTSEMFTVRKTSFGIGVERTFPLHSPRIEKIELLRSGKARRSKLYYLRKLSGKAARLAEKEDHSPKGAPSADSPDGTAAAPQAPAIQAAPEPAISR